MIVFVRWIERPFTIYTSLLFCMEMFRHTKFSDSKKQKRFYNNLPTLLLEHNQRRCICKCQFGGQQLACRQSYIHKMEMLGKDRLFYSLSLSLALFRYFCFVLFASPFKLANHLPNVNVENNNLALPVLLFSIIVFRNISRSCSKFCFYSVTSINSGVH